MQTCQFLQPPPVLQAVLLRLEQGGRRRAVRREVFGETHLGAREVDELERKLDEFKVYYNEYRVQASIDGKTPEQVSGDLPPTPAKLDRFAWRLHCRGLFQTPAAA